MEWRKSAKSALQQRPPKTYKVREPLLGFVISNKNIFHHILGGLLLKEKL